MPISRDTVLKIVQVWVVCQFSILRSLKKSLESVSPRAAPVVLIVDVDTVAILVSSIAVGMAL